MGIVAGGGQGSGNGIEGQLPGPERLHPGQRVGILWLHWACGRCEFCRQGLENLCPDAKFIVVARAHFCSWQGEGEG
ncbi:alcohol dehydrogenase catalytic domain-containing protein [Moorella sp. Hama-1]|uniref:alcohol dehydrogenase catalytic domain-containing protein n=1 Tax=Moorella sp. Hama-1 TaxID=2138101 RepID=UPI001F36F969|nr:alcohol dehydrogenase catalytic domain-containing protein [Moorella sp. Hama-1]